MRRRRPDESALQWTTFLPKDSVKIMVEGGWVTLTGEVSWEYQRQSAAAAGRYLMGVTGVSDQITTKPKVTAVAVKSDIEAALKRHAQADAQKISVSARTSLTTSPSATDVRRTGSHFGSVLH